MFKIESVVNWPVLAELAGFGFLFIYFFKVCFRCIEGFFFVQVTNRTTLTTTQSLSKALERMSQLMKLLNSSNRLESLRHV